MESLKQIYNRVWPYFDDTTAPPYELLKESQEARDKETERFNKRLQAASDFASSLIPLGDYWIEAVNNNVKDIVVNLHFPHGIIFSKEKREAYIDGMRQFLISVREAIITHGLTTKDKWVKQFEPLTCFLFGCYDFRNMVVKEGLSKDEADKEFIRMRKKGLTHIQTFCTDWFPAKYTTFGYIAKNDAKHRNNYTNILDNKEKVIAYLDKAVEKGLATKVGAKYRFTITKQLASILIEHIAIATENYDSKENNSLSPTKPTIEILWIRFEPLINYTARQLRDAKKNMNRPRPDKKTGGYEPEGYDKIKSLFDEETLSFIYRNR